jgi:hypothetical protein
MMKLGEGVVDARWRRGRFFVFEPDEGVGVVAMAEVGGEFACTHAGNK